MNVFRKNHALRIVAVLAMLGGWIVLSNHCALGRMALRAEVAMHKAHKCCNKGSSQPTKQPTDGKPEMQCCKSLHAIIPVDAKLPIASLEIFTLPVDWSLLAVALPEWCPAAPATGPPPDQPGFVELVLHRSLRSHAPPLLA